MSSIRPAFREFFRQASLGELLAWCLPALICGAILRGLLLAHFPYGYIHPDSPDFLVTADRFLMRGHRLVLHGKKSFLTPILFTLPMVVRIPATLIVPWLQHLSGLIYIVMTGALVRCWTRFWRWWIVPATMLAAVDPALLYYEHVLIAESQYMWCVTALALAGTVYAIEQTRGRFILLLVTLFLTAGSRPEGKLYVLFCLMLVPLALWGHWRTLAIYGSITLAFCIVTWESTRNTQAGLLLYATVLPLAPETPRSDPDFGPMIAPMREARVASGVLTLPKLVPEEKAISGVVYQYLKMKHRSGRSIGDFCQKLAVEAALRRPLMLPMLAVNKFLWGTYSPDNDGFGQHWLQDMQLNSCTYKNWMLKLMPRLTGRPIDTKEAIAAYIQEEFQPIKPDWFGGLQRVWFVGTTEPRAPLPVKIPGTPGFPVMYLLGFAGMAMGIARPGAMRKVHFAWVITIGFTAMVVMLTGVVNPRYRFVFEPIAMLYVFVLVDGILAMFLKGAPAQKHEQPAAALQQP